MNKKFGISASAGNLIIVFALFAVLIIISGFIYYNTDKDHYIKNTYKNLSAINRIKVSEINHWRKERIIDAKQFSGNPIFLRRLADYNKYGYESTLIPTSRARMEILKSTDLYLNAHLLDKNNNIILSIDSTQICHVTLESYKRTILQKKETFSDFYKCEHSDNIHLDLYVPFYSDSAYIGGLILEINPYKNLNRYLVSITDDSVTDEEYGNETLVNELVFNHGLIFKDNTFNTLNDNDKITKKAINGFTGTTEGTDGENNFVLANVSKIAGTDWILISKIDSNQALAPLITRGKYLSLILTLIIGFIGSSFYWFYNTRKKSVTIEQMKSRLEKEILQTHFEEAFRNANDMILLTDMKGNILEANNRVIETYGYTYDELRNKNIFEFRKNRDRKAIDETITAIEEIGEVRLETEHVKKSGVPFYVAISARKIEIQGKHYIQTIYHDITKRKLAESNSKALTEKLNLILSNIHAGIILINENEKINYLNGILCKEFDFDDNINEYIGKETKQYLHRIFDSFEDPGQVEYYMKDTIGKNETVYGKEFKFKNGKHYSIDYIPIFLDNGEFNKMWVFRDITERIEWGNRLAESEGKYRMLAEHINDVIWTLRADGKFLYISPSVEKLRGYTVEEVMNQDFSEIVCPESLIVVRESIKDFFDNYNRGKADEGLAVREIEQPRKDGTTVWTEVVVSAIFDEENNFKFFLGVSRDINERKKSEKRLQDSEKELRVIFDNAPAAMFLVNERGEILKINKTGETRYGNGGYVPIHGQCGELIKCINSIEVPEGCGFGSECGNCVLRKTIVSTIETGKEFNKVETTYETYDGNNELKRKTVLISASIATLEPEKTILVTLDDITERKNLEIELIAAKEKAEEMYRIKSNFLSNMSHELRTPMVGILGFSEILNEEIGDMELKRMAHVIHKSGSRLMETLNLILDLSLVESNKLDINITEFNLVSVVDEVITLFYNAAAIKKLFLVRDSDINAINVMLDSRLIHQILNNLINNAIKYTIKGGVTVSVVKEKILQEEFAVIRIKDTGIGIPEEKWDLIWEEFRQVSEGYNRMFEGTGLGLNITKRFVDKLGGEVRVEKSILGEGTTFKLTLPLAKEEKQELKNETNQTDTNEPNIISIKDGSLPEVLYVEDEMPAFILVKSYLNRYCNITHAASGNEAVELAEKNKFDFILMDINLGKGIDGLQTVKLIRNIEGYEKTAIVATTAYAMKEEKDEFLKNGCTHYISKPFLKKELISLIRNIIGSLNNAN
ncbi:MAG: PAS domain S-box protein [Bacteroidetes bacterium]|nr:PAS domain S-box protein [Bacteroidota bacterium]